MSNVVELPARRVPRDTFPIRLAIVRAEMGWNYDQAHAATGINSETWRLWEKGRRHCNDIVGAAAMIAAATGFSDQWIVFGGALEAQPPPSGHPVGGQRDTPSRRNNLCYSHSQVIIGPWDTSVHSRVTAA